MWRAGLHTEINFNTFIVLVFSAKLLPGIFSLRDSLRFTFLTNFLIEIHFLIFILLLLVLWKHHELLGYLSNRPHFLWVYQHGNPCEMFGACKSRAKGEWFISFSSVLPTSQVGYQAGKPIESVVYCFYKITLSKMENVSVFCEFTGTINHRFLTNQNARTILVIL